MGKIKKGCLRPGLNWGPCACEAHVITTTLRRLQLLKGLKTMTPLQNMLTTNILVCTLENCIDKGGLEVEDVGIFRGRLVWDIRKTVPHPRMSLSQAE